MAAGMGFAEIIILLMMGTFAPSDLDPLTPDQIMSGLPADCEMAAYVDVRGGFDELNAMLADLSTRPWVTSNREVSEILSEANAFLARAPAEATSMLGFNPLSDLTSISLCGRLGTGPSGEPLPSFLVVARGSFDSAVAATLAGQMDLVPVTLSNGAPAYGAVDDGVVMGGIASPSPGILYAGTDDLLAPRAMGTAVAGWETAGPDSLVGRVSALVLSGPRAFVGFQPSTGTRFLVGGELPVSFGKLVAGLERIVWVGSIDSSYMETRASSAEALRDHELILGGMAAYAQAAPLAIQAFAQMALGVLSPDDPELDAGLRSLVAHRDDFLSFLGEMGFFQEAEVIYATDPSTLTTSLTLNNTGGIEAIAVLFGMGMWLGTMTRAEPYPYPGEPTYYEDPAYYEEAEPAAPAEPAGP